MKDNNLLERCRSIDFSTESENMESNLEALKTKLAHQYENGSDTEQARVLPRTFRVKKMIAIAAALAAVFSLSVAVLAGPIAEYIAQWRTRVVEGEEHIYNFVVHVDSYGTERWEITFRDNDGRVVVEDDFGTHVLIDPSVFYDFDEAVALFPGEGLLLPTYIPEGFTFERAVFDICPLRNPDNNRVLTMTLYYTGIYGRVFVRISYLPYGGRFEFVGSTERIVINGHPAQLSTQGFGLNLRIGNICYHIIAPGLQINFPEIIRPEDSDETGPSISVAPWTRDELLNFDKANETAIRIAEGLR